MNYLGILTLIHNVKKNNTLFNWFCKFKTNGVIHHYK